LLCIVWSTSAYNVLETNTMEYIRKLSPQQTCTQYKTIDGNTQGSHTTLKNVNTQVKW